MAQNPVVIVATDNLEKSITVAIGGVRVEYFLGDRYRKTHQELEYWLSNGWDNYAVSNLTRRAHFIYNGCSHSQVPQEKGSSLVSDFQSKPSEEYSWTVIATTAKSLTYQSGRKWFKTDEDARTFAGEVFELEKNQRISFDLAIVQCMDVVKPKPQVELVSTFKKSEPSS